jgi:DNA-binding SARP family transcriptional activator
MRSSRAATETIARPLAARSPPGPPAALKGEMVRGRLLSLLAGRFERPVTVLVAGAGFGKTTLLAQAVRQNLTAPLGIDAWVSCQPGDENPALFADACCRPVSPGWAGTAGRAADVLAAMRELSPIDVCLVIDDAHLLAGSASEQLLAEVVRQLPRNGHVVLSGREPAGVPLARLRVTGACTEIGERELSFTGAEERSLARLLETPVPTGDLAGWPALVRLALTSQRAVGHQFLWEEVVSGLTPDDAAALLGLALVGWADGPALSSVCGRPVDAGLLAARVPLLTVSGDTVRAHELWTGSLERLYSRAQITAMLPAARDVLLARHDVHQLVSTAGRLRDPGLIRVAARELVRYTLASLPVQRARALLAAASPGDRDAPELLLLRAAIGHAAAVDDPAIGPLVDRATAAFAAAGDEPGEIAALALAGLVASTRGAYTDFLQIAIRVAELPAASGDPVLAVVSALVTATLAELNGDLAGALDALAQLPGPGASHPIQEPAARLRVYMLVLAGRADEAIPFAEAVLRQSSHPHVRRTPPFVRWSAGDVSELAELRDTVEPADDTNARDQFFYAALGTHVRASTGDADQLGVLTDLLGAMPINQADARDAAMLAAAVAVRLVASHDEAGARRALAAHLDRYPVWDPRCDAQLRRALATVYVCAPAVRPVWDTADLGRCHRRMLAAARALLAARDSAGRRLPRPASGALTDVLADTDALITMLPLPFSVELAVRAHDQGLPAGGRAVELIRRRLGGTVTAELRWQHEHGDAAVRRAARQLLAAAATRPARQVRIEVLGSARVFLDGSAVDSAAGRRSRVRQLLALLAVEPDLRRERAMALLWPGLDQAAAARNLRVTLTYLRQLFRGPPGGEPPDGPSADERFLLVDSAAIRLTAVPGLSVDLWQLDAHLTAAGVARAAGDQIGHAAALSAAAALWQGEPLADLQDLEEVSGAVTRVRTALVDSVLLLGEVQLSDGRAAESVQSAQSVLAADAYNERAHRLAIAAQIQLGDHTAAGEAARRMNEAFAEFGVSPSESTKILLRRIALAAAR